LSADSAPYGVGSMAQCLWDDTEAFMAAAELDDPCRSPEGAGCSDGFDWSAFFPTGLTWREAPRLCPGRPASEDALPFEPHLMSEVETEGYGFLAEDESVPLPFNEAVDRNLERFTTPPMRDRFARWLRRSGRYVPMMKAVFREAGLPEDLVYLALIESGFNPYARSWKRAVGPWQFIESTARRYGLTVNWWEDERRDPEKATRAAARYLADLYGRFGAWDLAMAAYNGGEGRIGRAVRRTKTDDFWKLRDTRHIRRETKNYVPKYIAATMIARNPARYGFDGLRYDDPLTYDEVRLETPIDLAVAARLAGVTVRDLKDLNPSLKRWATPPYRRGYVLRVPAGSGGRLLGGIAESRPQELFTMLPYRIEKGDTLGRIARRYGVPLKVLISMNPGIRPRRLRIGKVIRIPSGSALWAGDEGVVRGGAAWPYRVRKGDTLAGIARRYKVPLRSLLRINPDVNPRRMRPGDLIHIPARSA